MIKKLSVTALFLFFPIADAFADKAEIALEFLEVLSLIEENYYKPIDRELCGRQILEGGVSRCTDRYSHFLSPTEAKTQDEDLEGKFFGIGVAIGIEIERDWSLVVVESVLPGSPAHEAGLRSGDSILKVSSNGVKSKAVSTDDLSLREVVRLIRGKSDTKVYILIRRGIKLLDVIIPRKEIKIVTVSGKLIRPGVGYVRINVFEGSVDFEFETLVKDLAAQGAKALIVDLRDNPGGLLDKVVYLSGLFSSQEEDVVVLQKTLRPVNTLQTLLNQARSSFYNGGEFKNLKLVVLINEGSASASEIFAAYVRNYCGAVTVGKKTFGKGTVQQISNLRHGGQLRLTVAEYVVGEREIRINGLGIKPDFEVSNPEKVKDESKDAQLQKAIGLALDTIKKGD